MKRENVKAAMDRALFGIEENPFLFQRIMQEDTEKTLGNGRRWSILLAAVLIVIVSVTSLAVAASSYQRIINWKGEEIDQCPLLDTPSAPPAVSQDAADELMEILAQAEGKLLFTRVMSDDGSESIYGAKVGIKTMEELNAFIHEAAPYLPAVNWLPEGYVLEKAVVTYLSGADARPYLAQISHLSDGRSVYQYQISEEHALIDGYSISLKSVDNTRQNIVISAYIKPYNPRFVVDEGTAFLPLQIPGMDDALMLNTNGQYDIFMIRKLDEPIRTYYFSSGWSITDCPYVICTILCGRSYQEGIEMVFLTAQK